MDQPELSVVIPFLNEEQVLPLLRERLDKVRNRPAAWELLFVSDGSTDGSTRFIETWAREDPSVKLIVLTRNFGHQSAVSAGLSFASGNYIGIMDADLQDEPEVLLEMHRTLTEEKVDVVYAVRASRSETKLKRFFYLVFYRLYLYLADSPVQADSGDFCVMSRRAVGLLLSLPEKLRFVQGITYVDWAAVEAISHFTTSACSGLAAVFVAQADEAGVLGAHIFLDKTIEGGLRVRKHSVRRFRHRCAHLPWDCIVCQHSCRSTWVFDVGDRFALLQRIDLSVPGDSRRVHWSDVHGSKSAPVIHR